MAARTCPFRMPCWKYRGEECGAMISTHEYCRFHSSLKERSRRGLGNPRWAVAMRPTQEESEHTYDSLPKESNPFYQDYEKELEESGDLHMWETEYDEDMLKPFEISVTDENRHMLSMPIDTCRYKIIMGKYQAFYCRNENTPGSDFCNFHTSCAEIKFNIFRKSNPFPLWADCIIPRADDANLSISKFPWNTYNLSELMFFDLQLEDS